MGYGTGLGLLSQTGLARLDKPPSAARLHPSQVTIGLDRFRVSTSSAFSNQPLLDSLTGEEKAPPPHHHHHKPPRTPTHAPACSHRLAEAERVRWTGFARSNPSARPPPSLPRRMESSAGSVFFSPAYFAPGLLSRWLTRRFLPSIPYARGGAVTSLLRASTCMVSAIPRMSPTVG
jgi:hypothetical protein